jgi:hypothetical protein
VNPGDVQVELIFQRGVITTPCRDIETLDNRSLECGCRPYMVPDMNLSLLDSAAERRKNET